MKYTIAIIFLLSFNLLEAQKINIIPYPVEVIQLDGSYELKNTITVSSAIPAWTWKKQFEYFKSEMEKQFGISVKEAPIGKKGDIDFFMRRMPTSGKPAYTLEVDKNSIRINSNFDEPAFHAMQTLFQLIPLDPKAKKEIPFVKIFDHARFNYRGMHLDVCRHFFPTSYIKKYIDYLAYHKFNTFHWHLTEDQGWRIEIKKYPELTKIGGWRNGTIIGRYPGTGNDNIPYGGFYTQEEIKEVVQYAKERYIDVIPEIEMPGHSSAAIAAYPWLSCFPEKPTDIPASMISKKSIEEQKKGKIKLVQETWGIFDDVFCAGNDSTFQFLQNVIDEVITLFPSKYFHIGGDECPKTHWKICQRCQHRMKELGLKDEHELQSYFVQRIEKYLNSKGKTLIGWDEILEGGLAPNAVVMSWRGEQGGIDAAKQNHDVIMTPGNPVYFDHTQSENEDSVTIGGFNPIEKVYAYEPIPKELNEEQAKHVLGAQANMWTEYMKNTRKVEYMLFPRISALSEVLWSPKENRDWKDFENRLLGQFKRYDLWNVNYSTAYFDLKATVSPTISNIGIKWKLESKSKIDDILIYKWVEYGSSDGNIVSSKGECEREINSSGLYVGSLQTNKEVKSLIKQQFSFNKATGKKITLTNPASDKYPGDGPFTLVNGIQNEKGMSRTKEFLGFNGNDCIATIDLGKIESVSFVKVHYLHHPGSWIRQPSSVTVYVSENGIDFTSVVLSNPTIAKNEAICELLQPVNARFININIANAGIIPTGNPGAGNKAWLFVDEIEVE